MPNFYIIYVFTKWVYGFCTYETFFIFNQYILMKLAKTKGLCKNIQNDDG